MMHGQKIIKLRLHGSDCHLSPWVRRHAIRCTKRQYSNFKMCRTLYHTVYRCQ